MEVVAETRPLLACRGPFNEPTVSEPENVLFPVNVLFEYVFGIVVEEFAKLIAEVVLNAPPVLNERKLEALVVEKK